MTGYALWILVGILAAGIAARRQRDTVGLTGDQRLLLALAALAGAIFGAYGLELPADLLGWHGPPPPGASGDALPLGGRTVLGGMIGGWLCVEVFKRRLGIRGPTGDGFALPLAIALCCGRLGCVAAGCCAGIECAPSWLATTDAAGTPRIPVPWIEAAFHATAAITLVLAARTDRQPGRRLAIYLTIYAALRFGLEFVRPHPPILLGLTWYQLLALGLALLAGGTWLQRARSSRLR